MIRGLKIDKNLHILIVQDRRKEVFVAHCLDMDIATQGKTEKEAISILKELIEEQIKYCLKENMLDSLFRPAPKEYWDMFYRSQATEVINQLSLYNSRVIKDITSHLEFAHA